MPEIDEDLLRARTQSILETAVDAIITIDERGIVDSFNPAAERIFGYAEREILGRNVSVLMPEPFRANHDGYVANYLRTGQKKIIGIGREVIGRRRDGSVFPIDLAVSEISVRGHRFFTGMIRDITERKRMEAELRESEERLEFMVENLPTGAAYVDVGNATVVFNRSVEEITGYSRTEVTSLDEWFSRLFPGCATEAYHDYHAQRDAGFPNVITWSITHHRGKERTVQFAAHRYDHHEVWLLHDVTELKRAQQKLVQSERLAAIGQMMAGLAHESRNALQRTRASLEMLELDLSDCLDEIDLIRRAQRALDELNRLHEEVRGYAAPLVLETTDCFLPDVWRAVWDDLATVRKNRPVEFSESIKGVDLNLRVDRHRIGQVFRNVFDNAIAAAGESGEVRVECADLKTNGNSSLRISIIDDGPGFDVPQKERVFEPFFTTKSKGTGLGLAIAKRIVDAHDGDIEITGAQGSGAQVILTLPRERTGN